MSCCADYARLRRREKRESAAAPMPRVGLSTPLTDAGVGGLPSNLKEVTNRRAGRCSRLDQLVDFD